MVQNDSLVVRKHVILNTNLNSPCHFSRPSQHGINSKMLSLLGFSLIPMPTISITDQQLLIENMALVILIDEPAAMVPIVYVPDVHVVSDEFVAVSLD